MSELPIRRVAILGAGTMGSALAAHLTNVGLSVTLLDVTAAAAGEGHERMRSMLFVPERALEVRVLGFEEGDDAVANADWIVEAVREDLQIKRSLYARIAPYVRPDAAISTSGGSIPIQELMDGMSDAFATRFLSTHFTLPLSQRRFVEIRPGLATDPVLFDAMADFLADVAALRVVKTPAGPGSIVARYGLWSILLGIHSAEKLRLEVEDVDAIAGPFLGRPAAGVFGSADLIGLDKLRDAAANLRARTSNERIARPLALPNSLVGLLARGWNGDKSGHGFYRREGRERLALDLTTMVYRQHRDPSLPRLLSSGGAPLRERLRDALAGRDEVGEYLRESLVPSLRYAEALRESMGASPLDFDRTMQWGFGWEMGPFALLDLLGLGAVKYYDGDRVRNIAGGYDRVHPDTRTLIMEDAPIVERTVHYTLRDLGDGVEALVLNEGPLTPERTEALLKLLGGSTLSRFVLTSAGAEFPGLDLSFVYEALRKGDAAALESYLASLQRLGESLEAHPCVAAIPGRCVGTALGLALSCPIVVAVGSAEIGFDEGRLGLVPTARGLALLRGLHGESSKKLSELAVAMAEGWIAPSADLARQTGLLRSSDVTVYASERLLSTAKEVALNAQPRPRPSLPMAEGPLVGLIDRGLTERRMRGGLTDHDVAVGHRIRQVLARTTSYEEALERERRESIDLGSKALTLARLRHALETGRPIRN